MVHLLLTSLSLLFVGVSLVSAQALEVVNLGTHRQFINCGLYNPDSKGEVLFDMISEFSYHIKKHILGDVKKAPASPAFRTFLAGGEEPTPETRTLTTNIFKEMADGDEVFPERDPRPKKPTFVCLQENDPLPTSPQQGQRLYDYFCKDNRKMFYIKGENVNYFCPSFFDNLVQWPKKVDCPAVVDDNTFADPKSMNLTSNQFGIVMAGMAYLYIGKAAAGTPGLPGEFIDEVYVQRAFELDRTLQVRNAASYAYYAAALRAGCSTFPGSALPSHREELRRLHGLEGEFGDSEGGGVSFINGTIPGTEFIAIQNRVVATDDHLFINTTASHMP